MFKGLAFIAVVLVILTYNEVKSQSKLWNNHNNILLLVINYY